MALKRELVVTSVGTVSGTAVWQEVWLSYFERVFPF